jgi:hypothetical protein
MGRPMEWDNAPLHNADDVDEETDEAPPAGVLRTVGELLAAVLTVAAVLAALLLAAITVQWIVR